MSIDARPKILLVRESFAQRYLAWASNECRSEVASGLNRLRRVPGPFLAGVTRSIETLSETDQILLFSGFLNRLRKHVGLSVIEDSEVKQNLLDAFERKMDEWEQSPAYGLSILRYCQGSLDQPKLRKLVKTVLAPILGKPKGGDPSTWRYRSHFGQFTLCTEVSCSVRKLTYWHLLYLGRHEYWPERPNECRVFDAISFLGWLGLGGPTQMEGFGNDEIFEIAQTVGNFCEYFLSALPALTHGLSTEQ